MGEEGEGVDEDVCEEGREMKCDGEGREGSRVEGNKRGGTLGS